MQQNIEELQQKAREEYTYKFEEKDMWGWCDKYISKAFEAGRKAEREEILEDCKKLKYYYAEDIINQINLRN